MVGDISKGKIVAIITNKLCKVFSLFEIICFEFAICFSFDRNHVVVVSEDNDLIFIAHRLIFSVPRVSTFEYVLNVVFAQSVLRQFVSGHVPSFTYATLVTFPFVIGNLSFTKRVLLLLRLCEHRSSFFNLVSQILARIAP